MELFFKIILFITIFPNLYDYFSSFCIEHDAIIYGGWQPLPSSAIKPSGAVLKDAAL